MEANSPEGKTSPGNPTGANEKGDYNYFTPWGIGGLAQRGLSSSLWDIRLPSFGKGLSPKTAAVSTVPSGSDRENEYKLLQLEKRKGPFPCFFRTQHTGSPSAIGTFFLAAVSVVNDPHFCMDFLWRSCLVPEGKEVHPPI